MADVVSSVLTHMNGDVDEIWVDFALLILIEWETVKECSLKQPPRQRIALERIRNHVAIEQFKNH